MPKNLYAPYRLERISEVLDNDRFFNRHSGRKFELSMRSGRRKVNVTSLAESVVTLMIEGDVDADKATKREILGFAVRAKAMLFATRH